MSTVVVRRRLAIGVTAAGLALSPVLPAQSRAPVDGGRTYSLGLPSRWEWSAGAATRSVNAAGPDPSTTQARLGATRALGNPVVQGLALHLEAFAGAAQRSGDGGVRAQLRAPMLRLGVGLEYDVPRERTDLTWSFVHPVRRGGLFRDGSQLRFDWIPARGNSVTVGVEFPIARDVPTGRTRPLSDRVRLRGPAMAAGPALPPLPDLAAALAELRDAARAIRLLAVPFLGRERPATGRPAVLPTALRELDALVRRSAPAGDAGAATSPPTTVDREARRYHAALDAAFTAVLDRDASRPPRGPAAADAARRVLLDEVLLPYDRLLGQVRSPDTIRRFGHLAQGSFLRWLHAEGAATGADATDALAVLTAVLGTIETERAALARTWDESRFVWLPLQYALRPEDHDTQAELDALVARAVEEPFTEGNRVSYVINEQFQYQLGRTIRAAEDYHVLVTHDFRGLDDRGDPDQVAYAQVLRSYLTAMTERVRAYDRTGRFPTYLIIHDQWYFSLREAPLFLRLLEDPTGHHVRLPASHRAWADSIAMAQAALREAIGRSSLLQRQRRLYGDRWLRDLIKVHVSVTNRPDPTFWSWTLIPGLPVPDAMLRDHRKLVFYDVTEADPYRGEALYTGAGVGEHYTTVTWEDRALLVRGPALLGLKTAVRQLLLDHGVADSRIPHALRPVPRALDYDAQVRAATAQAGWPLRAVGVHNGSGYLPKDVNVAKAVLYTLMPAGSVIMVPDSFWNSEFWGAALFGAALRGARVLVIAPSYRSNSVDVFGTQLLTRELLARMLDARTRFAPALAATGGLLQIGIYDSRIPTTDIPAKLTAVQETFAAEPWLRELFGFDPHVYEELDRLRAYIANVRTAPAGRDFERAPATKIHLKANLFASREAWTMMRLPSWGEMTWAFVSQRIVQVQDRPLAANAVDGVAEPTLDVGASEVQRWYASLAPAARERVVFYAVMGSQNQNARSMVMDAEDALVVAQWPSVIPYIDVVSLIGQSAWIADQEELDLLLPPMGPLRTWISHRARLAY